MNKDFYKQVQQAIIKFAENQKYSNSFYFKNGGIYIKKQNRGKFTDYCGGKVTNECIQKGKRSTNPKIRKRATFAENSRKYFNK